jgi:hypothetical protein
MSSWVGDCMIGKLADTAMQERWQGKGGIEVWYGGPMGWVTSTTVRSVQDLRIQTGRLATEEEHGKGKMVNLIIGQLNLHCV